MLSMGNEKKSNYFQVHNLLFSMYYCRIKKRTEKKKRLKKKKKYGIDWYSNTAERARHFGKPGGTPSWIICAFGFFFFFWII